MSDLLPRQKLLHAAYDKLWSQRSNTEDSPDKSRAAIARRIFSTIADKDGACTVLDIGSGPLPVELEVAHMLAQKPHQKLRDKFRDNGRFYSLDLSLIPRNRIVKASRRIPLLHTQADAERLPYRTDSIDVVVANHSFDMLGVSSAEFERSLLEVSRVLKPNGLFMANFHHASLGSSFTEIVERQTDLLVADTFVAQYYDPIRENPYFETENDIQSHLHAAGLHIGQIALESDNYDQWWSVEATSLSSALV